MRCFVTGASGQIGTALLRELDRQGHALTALVMPGDAQADAAFAGVPVDRVIGDIRDPDSLPAADFDWVFHLAANQSFWRGDAAVQRAINVEGVRNLLDWAAGRRPGRLVHVSSLAAVGLADRPDEVLDETAAFAGRAPQLLYFRSKHDGEALVRAASDGGLPAVIANPGTVMGPWDRTGHFWRMLGPMLTGRIRGVSRGGTNVVDVRDVARGLIAAAERGVVGERYLLTGHNRTYREFANKASRLAGVPPPQLTFPTLPLRVLAAVLHPAGLALRRRPPLTPDDVIVGARYLYFDNAKARRELGFEPRSLADSLRDTLAWYRRTGVWSSAGVSAVP